MKKLTALFMALILMITCLPTTVLAQKSNEPVVSGEVRKIEGETIVEEDGKAYVAFDIGNIKLKESKMKKRGKRDLTSQTIYRQNAPASNPYDRFKLKVLYLGRGLNEFKLPTQDVEIVENGTRKTIKAFEVKLSTSEPSTSTVKEVVLGHRYVQESEVGFTQAGVVAYPFTMDTSVQDLDTKLEGSLRILVPYTYLYHPELNIEDSREGTIFVLYLKQKVNPLWKSEWHIKDEQNKPDIFAYYKHTQEGENSYFKLPKDDKKVYTMESGKGVTDLYWDGTGVVNAYPENKDKAKEGGHFYPIIIGREAIVDRNSRDYTGKISYDNLKFTSDATTPNITTGFGDPDYPNTDGFIKVDNVKYLLNLYPTDKQQTDINAKVKNYVTGEEELAYRQIKRYAVYEALEVKFNTGKGFLSEADKTANKSNQEIGAAQEIGYSEKIAGNESGRKINVPTDTLVPPEAAAGEPANEFKGWALTADATTPLFKNQGEANAYVKPFTETTTFHAIYGPKAQGKVKVEYVDASNQPIDAKYQLKGQEYPAEKPGNIDETVGTEVASTAKAPKFLGYEVTGVEVKPATGQTTATYTDPATATVTYKYKKLDPIIPEDKATQDVKDTYKPVTIKVDSAKGELKKGATKAADINVYYVNPVEGKTLQDVLTASDLTAESKDANVYKIDTAKPWKFDPTQTEGTPTVPAADFALTTVVGKDNVKDTGVVMEVNFKQTKADQLKDKLEPVPIKVWVGDGITWSKGVKLNAASENNQALKDLLAAATVTDLGPNGTLAQPATARTSGTQNLPNGEMGNLKVAFDDGSALVVENQMLYVSPLKVPVKPNEPNQIDPEKLPDDKLAVEFKLGEGVKIGNTEGKTNPVLYETIYVKSGESLEAGDIPTTELQNGYKDNKWYNGNAELKAADYTNITKAKEFIAKAVQKGNGTAVLKFIDNEGNALEPATNTKLQITGENYNPSISGKDGTDISYDKSKAPKILGYVFTNENAVINPAKFAERQVATITLKYKKLDDVYKGKDDNGNDTPDVPGNDPDKDNIIDIIKKTYVKVKFLADKATRTSDEDADKDKNTYRRGKLNTNENEVFYYINPKAKDTLGDFITQQEIVVPTINPKNEYKEASPKWNPDLDNAKTKAVGENPKELIFTAQYEEKGKSNVMFSFKFFKKEAGSSTEESVADNKLGKFIPPVLTNSNQLVGNPITFNSYTDKTINEGDLQGTWHFEGWYKESDTSFTTKVTSAVVSETASDNKFVGKWILSEKAKYSVTYKYEYTNNTGINNPSTDDIEPAPTDSNEYYENVNVPANANKPSKKRVQVKESGKVIGEWVFQGWKPNPLTISSTKANEFIGTWEFTEKLVRPVDPNHPDKRADEVEVKFLKGEHGKLSGIALVGGNEVNVTGRDELAYYVKEKATWAAMKGYIPTALADYGWRVANPSWKPVLPEVTVKVVAGEKEFTAQYVAKPTDRYITLTLDENYRNGKITDYEVLEGDLIEDYLYIPRRRGYIFKGWSYNSRRLEEVRPGDRVYEPTVLYAIWLKKEARETEDLEPIDTREVNEHKAYMFGYTDGTVRPNGSITRAEAAALVTRLLGIEAYASSEQPVFTDTPSSWYNKAINAAVARGIMKGYPDGRFRPNAPITRAEFTQMIYTFDNKPYGEAPFADVKGHWAERAIGSEYQAKRIAGYPDGLFRPDANITRAEAVVILNKIFERNYDAMSAINAMNKEKIKVFTDLYRSFWGYNEMIEACNTHSFKRRRAGFVEEDWTLVK